MLVSTLKALQFYPRDAKQKVSSEILIHRRVNCTKGPEEVILYTTMKAAPVAEVQPGFQQMPTIDSFEKIVRGFQLLNVGAKFYIVDVHNEPVCIELTLLMLLIVIFFRYSFV